MIMAALSDYLEEQLLNHVFGAGSYPKPAALFLALFTSPTDDATGGAEVADPDYLRQAITFAAAVSPDGTISNNASVQFPLAGADWGTVTHFAIHDAATAGNRLAHGPLTSGKAVNSGDRAELAAGQLTISLD